MNKAKSSESTVNTINYMISHVEHPEKIIASIISEQRPDKRLIQEFYKYITKEMFISAYRTTDKLRKEFPELWDENAYLNGLSKNLDYRKSMEKFQNDAKKNAVHAFLQTVLNGDTDIEVPTIAENAIPIKNMTLSDVVKYRKKLHLSEKNIINIINNAYEDEFTTENVINLLGISESIDTLLFENIYADNTKLTTIINKLLETNPSKLSSTSMSLFTNDQINAIFKNEISAETFVKAICKNKNLGFKLDKCEEVYSGKIKLTTSGSTFDSDLGELLYSFPEKEVIRFINNFKELLPRAFSYKVMAFLLKHKEFSENNLIELYHTFKQAGLASAIKEYAEKHYYEKLAKME